MDISYGTVDELCVHWSYVGAKYANDPFLINSIYVKGHDGEISFWTKPQARLVCYIDHKIGLDGVEE